MHKEENVNMTGSDHSAKAVHFSGGNYFDDIRIDISESHRRFDKVDRSTQNTLIPKYRNIIKLFFTKITIVLGVHEFLTVNGINGRWFKDFSAYWGNILDGRPLWTIFDFFHLLHDYRKRQQHTSQLEWGDPAQHLTNWQHPREIYSTLHQTIKLATHPTASLGVMKKLSPGMRILEYGCSLAPYYYGYNEFYTHLGCHWTLADIPNYPFHYAKYLYRNHQNVDFVTISDTNYTDPLADVRNFDVIILTEVMEHLDNPLFIAKYLLKKLNSDGLFVFDYILSEGMGLDHPNAIEMRQDCLKYILDKTEIIYGNIDILNDSIGLCIARKKF